MRRWLTNTLKRSIQYLGVALAGIIAGAAYLWLSQLSLPYVVVLGVSALSGLILAHFFWTKLDTLLFYIPKKIEATQAEAIMLAESLTTNVRMAEEQFNALTVRMATRVLTGYALGISQNQKQRTASLRDETSFTPSQAITIRTDEETRSHILSVV